jgi:chromosome partitioning protein
VAQDVDYLIFDTPGRDDARPPCRHQRRYAGHPAQRQLRRFRPDRPGGRGTFKVRRLSFYAELIWEARKKRAMATISEHRREMDWVVVRNRTQHIEARNMRRIDRL